MKLMMLILMVATMMACDKDDNNNTPSTYPIVYSFNHIDQTDEGLYLVTGPGTLADLAVSTGSYGQYKDSLKTDLQKSIKSQLDLNTIELTSDTTLAFHYIYLGHPVVTPVKYTFQNGQIILPDSIFNGLVAFDHTADQFVICGATPFALPGPNATNPLGPPYFTFDIIECIEAHENREYALDYLTAKNLQPIDTIGVLLTRYIYSK